MQLFSTFNKCDLTGSSTVPAKYFKQKMYIFKGLFILLKYHNATIYGKIVSGTLDCLIN